MPIYRRAAVGRGPYRRPGPVYRPVYTSPLTTALVAGTTAAVVSSSMNRSQPTVVNNYYQNAPQVAIVVTLPDGTQGYELNGYYYNSQNQVVGRKV